jgi:beta-phosphoglucomutase-like phosphatase (HAD superfamily)
MSGAKYTPGRQRPLNSVLDLLRARIDLADYDTVLLSLDAVAADLGYGDVRPLPGSIAWVDHLRGLGKKVAVISDGERARDALELAGIDDRFDAVVSAARATDRLARAIEELDADPRRTIAVDVDPRELSSARDAGIQLAIGLARGEAKPEALRQAGADAVVADLQELIGPF